MSSGLEIPSVLQIVRRNTGSKPSIPSRSAKASSGYRGVSSQGNRWRARICIDKVEYTIGDFDTEDEAAQAYDIEAIKRGKLKYLNFVYQGLNDKPPIQKKRKPARKRKAQAGLDATASSGGSKMSRSDVQSDSPASSQPSLQAVAMMATAGPSSASMPPATPSSTVSSKIVQGTESVTGVLHIPRETNPNLKARPKVRNRNGKKYARVSDASFMSADARYFPADFARASGDLFDPARVYFADTSVHEPHAPLYSVPSADSEQGPCLPRTPTNPYFSMANAAPNKGGAAISNESGQHNAPVGQAIPLVAPPVPPLTVWGRMSAQAQHLANAFANSSTPAVTSFGKSGTQGVIGSKSNMQAADRAQAIQLLSFFRIPEVKVVLSDEMRQKLKYVVLTGGPQVLTMVDAAVEVFKLTDDIHELLDTLGHVYRVWLNAALALGLFGDYVPYMFSQQAKAPSQQVSNPVIVRAKQDCQPFAAQPDPGLQPPPFIQPLGTATSGNSFKQLISSGAGQMSVTGAAQMNHGYVLPVLPPAPTAAVGGSELYAEACAEAQTADL